MIPLISSLLNTLLLAVIGNPDCSLFPLAHCFNLGSWFCTLPFHLLEVWFEDDCNDWLWMGFQKLRLLL